jgi:ketosteroid isomerase-like protein
VSAGADRIDRILGAAEAGTSNAAPPGDARLTHARAVKLARSYVAAYNDRDLDAMLALQDENVVSHPARLFGHRPHTGHAGVRAWWARMVAAGRWYRVVVHDIRLLGTDRVAVLGEIRGDEQELLSPWAVVVRIRNGLIVESRSYLSDANLLEELGVLR